MTGNYVTNNYYGISFSFSGNGPYSSNNLIYHNDFVDNAGQVQVDPDAYGSANIWDDGYPSGGNYWSDYAGADLYKGPYQNITGSDGIGDTPRIIDNYNQDNYPSTRVFAPPSISEMKAFYTLDSFFLGDMYGLVPENQYFVKGNNISSVEFKISLNDTEQIYISSAPDEDGWFNSSSIDMAQVTSDLMVTAHSSSGDSVSYTLPTNVYDTPYWLQSLIEMAQEKGYLNVTIDPTQPLTRFDNVWSIGFYYNWPETPMNAVYDIPVPIIGGKYGITCGFGFNMGLQSNGKAVVGGGGGLQFYIADAEAKIGIYVTGAIGIENGTIRLSSLTIQINGAVQVPFKQEYSWNGIGLEVAVYVGGSVSYTLYLREAPSGNGTFGYGLDWVATRADIALWLGAYAQVGCWVGEVRIEGQGKVTFTFHMPPPYFTYPDDLKVEATITLTVRSWWFCWQRDIFTYSSHSPVQWTLNSSETGWIPREWASGNYSIYKWPGNASEGTYLENVYPYANPSVDTSSNRTIMVWTQDDLSKPYIQGYDIYYATLDKATGNWSLPAAVTNNMIPEGDAIVRFDSNGNAVAVWTQLNNSSLNETIDPFSLLTNVQLAYAVWNPATNAWSQPGQITNDRKFHYSPTLISDNETGNLMLVWIADNDGNLTTCNDQAIYTSIWNGTAWSNPTLVAAPGLLASTVAGAYHDGKAVVVWSAHMGDNATTTNDTELFYCQFSNNSWGLPTRLTTNSLEDTEPSVAFRYGHPVFAWIQRNETDALMFFDPENGSPRSVLERPRVSSPRLSVDSQDHALVAWADSDSETPFSFSLSPDGSITFVELLGNSTQRSICCKTVPYRDVTTDMNDSSPVHVIDLDAQLLVSSLTSLKTVVSEGQLDQINVTIANQGYFTHLLNVTVYANSTAIYVCPVTLQGGTTSTLTFIWNTTGFAKGNYTISAYAEPVPGEIDTADNNCTGGLITVTVPGDVTGDLWVDMQDISMLIDGFMTYPEHPRWNPNCDVNNDLSVDMLDISIAIDHFMQS